MKRPVRALAAALVLLALPGCAVVGVAGNVVEGAANVTGAVVGGAVDIVTTSEEEQLKKDVEAMKRAREGRD
jgi:predicted aminopeptidase